MHTFLSVLLGVGLGVILTIASLAVYLGYKLANTDEKK